MPPEYADHYCNGACLSETYLVLNCIDNILSHFLFYNRATIRDVRETIKAACSYGPKRGKNIIFFWFFVDNNRNLIKFYFYSTGDFNVAEHIDAEENSAQKGSKTNLFGLLLMIIYMGYNVLF